MAVAAITVVVQQVWSEGKMFHVVGTVDFDPSAATYATGGNTVNFNDPLIKAQRAPVMVVLQSLVGSGYLYSYVPGTDNTNGKIMVLTGAAAQSPLTEFTAGAVPAGVSGDTIQFHAMFLGMN